MSVMTTAKLTTTQSHRALNDYTIHLTGASEQPDPVNPREEPAVENPADWPQDYHNVPAYRAIDRNLHMEERPGGTSPIERAFIFIMLHGVWLNAVSILYQMILLKAELTFVPDGRAIVAQDRWTSQ
jgi:hypothetical protein